MVLKSIESVVAARYPAERLEILVVDAGSKDDTWDYIQQAAALHPLMVTAVKFPQNRGKQAALAAGFERAGESAYGTVYCCPGALTAYRASAVRKVLDQWMSQFFLGVRCTFGEDRAMTNFLLAAGYDTVYQGSAIVRTVVPITYAKMSKMFLRWDRSYVREELRLMKIAWKRRPVARLITLYDRIITNPQFPIGYVALAMLVITVVAHPVLLLTIPPRDAPHVGTQHGLRSQERAVASEHDVRSAHGLFLDLRNVMDPPYAFFTVRARSWLTR